MQKIVTLLIVLAGLAALAYPGAMLVDTAFGRDVIILTSLKDEEIRELELFQLDDDFEDADASDPAYQLAVVKAYGLPPNDLQPDRVLFVDDEQVVVPEQLAGTGVEILPRTEDNYALQALSVTYTAGIASLVGVLSFVGLLVLRSRLGPRADVDGGVPATA